MFEQLQKVKNRRVMVVGCGAIGSELVKRLINTGYRYISIISSEDKSSQFKGVTFYNRERPIEAIAGFKPDVVIDTSVTEFTQKILGGILRNKSLKNFKYVAITPNIGSDKVSTEKDIIEPNRYLFESRGITVIRTDETNSLFSDMIKELKGVLRKDNFARLDIWDEHRSEKELFTQGGVSTLINCVEWAKVEKISVQVNGGPFEIKRIGDVSSEFFNNIVSELRRRQMIFGCGVERLRAVSIKIDMIGGRILEIKSKREIPNSNFEKMKGFRSVNFIRSITPHGSKATFGANISKEVIADGILKRHLQPGGNDRYNGTVFMDGR